MIVFINESKKKSKSKKYSRDCVFHGTSKKITVDQIDLSYSKEYLDFGIGFYLTKYLGQAKQWAERTLSPHVNVYRMNPIVYKLPSTKIFTDYDFEWLDYIICCRLGLPLPVDYDIVIGPMADAKTYKVIQQWSDRGSHENEKIELLQSLKFNSPNNQICIKNSKYFNDHYLVFKEVIKL